MVIIVPKFQLPAWRRMREEQFPAKKIIKHLGIIRPPVDIHKLIPSMGVELTTSSDPNVAGSVHIDEAGRATISYTSSDPWLRQRYTLAHEVSHLILHTTSTNNIVDSQDSFSANDMEVEANRFAADLIMPLDMIIDHVELYGDNIQHLAQRFDVSPEAIVIRLELLAGFP